MRIGGLQKTSLIDFPGIVSCVIFTQGCNFRCPYCHNADLVLPELFGNLLTEKEIFLFLKERVGRLQGVVLSGGEPTIQEDIISFIEKIKEMKYRIKLDTNGSHPDVLKRLLKENLLDYVAMDIKTSLENYSKVVGCLVDVEKIKESIALILNSYVFYEFRTTCVKPLHQEKDFGEIFHMIQNARRFVAQKFEPSQKVLDKELLQAEHFSQEDIARIQESWERISKGK